MGVTWIDPVDITPSTTGSYVDIDVSSYCPAGTTGVILQFITNTTTGRKYYFRCNGSTDDRIINVVNITVNKTIFVGVDNNRIFEAYFSSVANVKVYLCGYFDSCAVFNVNGVDKSLTTTGEWADIDIGVDDSAIGAIIEISNAYAGIRECGLRKNGSTDNRHYDVVGNANLVSAIIGVDGNEICEGYIEHTAVDFFLTGYIKSGVTFNTNAIDLSLSSTGDYYDLTALPSGATGGFIEVVDVSASTVAYSYNLRKKGTSYDNYYDVWCHNWFAVECDSSRLIEGKIENAAVDFFLTGYSTGTAPTYSKINIRSGSSWINPSAIKVWNGSAWAEPSSIKIRSGSEWVTIT